MAYSNAVELRKMRPRALARANGDLTYMPDKPCKRGHLNLRYTKQGQCSECLVVSKAAYKSSERGIKKAKEYSKRYGIENKDKLRVSPYNITVDEYTALVCKQGGLCAICKNVLDKARKTHIDHCHKTDKVRGVLCNYCNVGLGMFKDNLSLLSAAIFYLNSYK